MEHETINKLITENMKTILGFSISRLSDRYEAEHLASDIIYEILKSAHKLKDDSRFYGYMWRIAENTYVNYLRSRKKDKTIEIDEDFTDNSLSVQDELVFGEDLNRLRRELSLLSELYRQATVLYYMENLSCGQIAGELNISTEMVKYYLFRARKIMREGMDMDRIFGEKSYNPKTFEIDFWGTKAGDDHEYREFQKRKIRGNILLAAYYTPVSVQELSIELGVAVTYLEDELNLLIKRQYLICKKGKYLTNIPIFTAECSKEIEKKTYELAHDAAKRLSETFDIEFGNQFGDKFQNENLLRWQGIMFCSHFSLNKNNSYFEKAYGGLPKTGPYSLVNGGGGHGFVWGRSCDGTDNNGIKRGICGVYNNVPSQDGKGSVIAFNFNQTINGQHFMTNMVDSIVSTAIGCFESLSKECKMWMEKYAYSINGHPNFPSYSNNQYERIPSMLKNGIDIFSDLNHKTFEIAGKISADHAPEHIRKTAEYVGAFVYQFNSLDNIVSELFEYGWLKPVSDTDKPAMCVIKH